ncbi:hypothetical protein YC2023_040343 [Brassica napus]
MDSDMVEIAPPAFAWCSKTLEIHKGFSGDECSPALKRFVSFHVFPKNAVLFDIFGRTEFVFTVVSN